MRVRTAIEGRWFTAVSIVALAVALVPCVASLTAFARTSRSSFASFIDFRAFYCAAATARRGDDPYRAEPLRACEQQLPGDAEMRGGDLVVPAPLPGYALFALEPFAALPFETALVLWLAVLIAAVGATAVALIRATNAPPALVAAAVLFGDALVSLPQGQIAPLAVGALALAAWLLERDAIGPATLCAAATMLVPNIGIPACVALFVAERRSRGWLLVFGAVAVAMTLAATGLAASIEYAVRVLPTHVASELGYDEQYSFANVLYRRGLSASAAIAVADGAYAAALGAGVLAGLRVRAASGRRSLAVTFPVVLTLLFAPFVHLEHIAAAFPAAFAILADPRRERRIAAIVVVVMLAVPLKVAALVTASSGLVVWACIAAALLVLERSKWSLGVVLALLPLFALAPHGMLAPAGIPLDVRIAHDTGRELAEVPWHAAVERVRPRAMLTLLKLPTTCALLLVALIAVERACFRDERPAPERPTWLARMLRTSS